SSVGNPQYESRAVSVGITPQMRAGLCIGMLSDISLDQPQDSFRRLLLELPIDERHYWIGTLYTLLLPAKVRRSQATYFTPPAVADAVVDLAIKAGFDLATDTVLDPAAGGAAFLSTLAGRMAAAGLNKEEAACRLDGIEIDEGLATLSSYLITERLGSAPSRTLIITGDALAVSMPDKYRLVIANPPYGRIGFSEMRGKAWSNVAHSGHINKYALFTELCFRHAKPGGIVALVIPSSFRAGPLYDRMRSFVRSQAQVLAVGSVEGRDGVFIDVAQDVSILIAQKGKPHKADAPVRFPQVGLVAKADPIIEQRLPIEPGEAWPLPAIDPTLIGGATLSDYGVQARAGYFVWNREKDRLVANLGRRQRGYPLVWAKNVRPDELCRPAGEIRSLKKANPEVLTRLQNEQNDSGRQFQWIEVNMLPVSYRANSTFYVQRTSFIEFEDSAVVELMTSRRRDGLISRLAQIHNIPFAEPSDDLVRESVEAEQRRAGEWEGYEIYLGMAEKAERTGRTDAARRHRENADALREDWFANGIVERGKLGSPEILQAISVREDWTQRYDPIRLTIQHDAFVREHIEQAMVRHAAVDVMNPDVALTDVVNNPSRKAKYQATVGTLLGHLGIERLVMIRGLPICEFSYGYTRVSATPIYQREHNGQRVDMPVRLKAFDQLPIKDNKRPIYVTQQLNEALYFRIDEGRVLRWLAENHIVHVPGEHVGRAYIERYNDFGPFLEVFKDREGAGGYPRMLPAYVYLLLHTLSHQMMHSLADTSGVDRDAIGEYVFPADLSFVIYRKGMTPDLGNISAMWRNYSETFLKRALDPRTLRCGSGSLCDARGGACPACVMVSEVNCIASNLLLSRAALKGGQGPEWEPRTEPNLVGFFDPRLA
ncbi:MAG: N-6 DNA methylase, partial [Pseudomonadota bacterium]